MTNAPYPTFSIVIETDNLAVVDLKEIYACLDSLALQSGLLHQADGIFVADGGVVPEETLQGLRARYPWVTIIRSDDGAAYIELKSERLARSDTTI